ncbi:hypothetical protein N7541_007996 [Penicillium brevicompactum]|uniref:Uncharacterized protein n=1 Tax=Penicillium brevicompactum TaxID=5074 RepID=A0A9W9R177_PENBR|nr:hypothetical protein N7541_007996 [Penicillium brevicompactum]
MTPPDKSSTESRMHTLLADFQKSIETSDRARVSAEPTVSSQKIPRSILKNRERTSSRRDRSEDRPRKKVRFEPASGGPLKESVLSSAHAPEKSIASWSVSFFVPHPPNISIPVLLLIYYAGRAGDKGLIRTNNRSLREKFKPDERQSRRNGGNSPQSMKNKDHIEVFGTEVKSLKRELETMRSCRSDARSSEQDR